MFLTNIGVMLTLTTSVSGSTSSSDNTLQLVTVILTGVYVAATLVIVGLTIWQSKAALTASARQSQAAIDAVHDQIKASEKQSQAAIDAVFEQIQQSKQPILIPLSTLPLTGALQLDYAHSELSLKLMNVGTGVALNIWGVLVQPKNIPQREYSFRNQAHLLQGEDEKVVFRMDQFHYFTENDKIGEHDLWPSSELIQVGTTNVLRYAARLTLTYIDVFSIKHATIYDYTTVNEWKIVEHFRVQHDLEDMYKEREH